MSEITRQVEEKTMTVPIGGDSKATSAEVESMFDTLPAFMDKKGAEQVEKKQAAPATPEQKEELRGMIDETPQKPKEEVKEAPKTEEKKVEPPVAVEKKEVPKPEPHKFDDLSDDGINREVESLKTGKQETKQRYAALLTELRKEREAGNMTKKEFEAAKSELEQVKKTAVEASNKAVVPDDVVKQQQAEKEELAMFRRQYQLEKDPELKKNFDDRIESVEQAITSTLNEAGLHPEAVKIIQKAGGWTQFSKSRAAMAWMQENPETGEQETHRGTQAEYARFVLSKIDPADAAAINARTGEQAVIRDNKTRFVDEEKKKATEFFKNLETQSTSRQEQVKSLQAKLESQYNEWVEKASKEQDFLKDKPIPDGATADAKKAIETENQLTAKVREYIKEQKKTTTFEGYTALVMNAAKGFASDRLVKENQEKAANAEKKIAELEAELKKVRSAGKTINGGTLTGVAGQKQEPTKKKGVESVEDVLNELENFAKSRQSE